MSKILGQKIDIALTQHKAQTRCTNLEIDYAKKNLQGCKKLLASV